MHDPYFEATCADIRGLDLGDDALVLAALDAIGDDLRPEDRLLRAVVRARTNRLDDALADLHAVAEAGTAPSLCWYLAAHLKARAEDLTGAQDLLRKAEQAARTDKLVPPADLAHARGRLEWLGGDPAAALSAVTVGLRADDTNAARWLDKARLAMEIDDHAQAKQAIEAALQLESDSAAAHYEAAVLASLGAAEPSTARRWEAAFALDPSLRERAADDDRLGRARDAPHLAAVLGPPPAPDRRWLADAPDWLRVLADDPALAERGIEIAGDPERHRHAEELRATYERSGPTGTLHSEATLAESRRRLATMGLVARVPIRPTREGQRAHAELWLDEAAPDRLWLAWSDHMAPFLWIDVGQRVETLVAAIDPLSSDPPPADELTCVHRAFIGYAGQIFVPHPLTGEVEAGGIAQLEQHLSLSPFCESGAWGSAYADDPWPDTVPTQPGLAAKLEARQVEVAAQSPAHPWSMTRRLRHSRGYLTLELHHHELVVLEVRARPNRHPKTVAAMNAAFGCGYPETMPLDAIAAVIGFVFDTASDLQPELAALHDEPEQLAGLLYVLSALRHSELAAHEIWNAHADHAAEIVRTTVVDIAFAYNFESLLEVRSMLEKDAQLRAEIEAALDAGLEPPSWDPYAEDPDAEDPDAEDPDAEDPDAEEDPP